MALSLLSTTDTGAGVRVIVTTDGSTQAGEFLYPQTAPDARGQAQWLLDCGAAALGLVTGPGVGNGGPDATVADDTATVLG